MTRRLPAVLWTLGVLASCLAPGVYVPDVPILSVDKLVHVGLFLVFGLLWLALYPARRVAVVAWGLGLAVAIEVLQQTLPIGRSGEVFDAAADAVGLALAVGVHSALRLSRASSRAAAPHATRPQTGT